MVEPVHQRIDEAHPLRVFLNARMSDCVADAHFRFGAEPSSVAIALIMLLSRQLAMIDRECAAVVLDAVSAEVRANYSSAAATEARVAATIAMFDLSRAVTERFVAEHRDAVSSGRVS